MVLRCFDGIFFSESRSTVALAKAIQFDNKLHITKVYAKTKQQQIAQCDFQMLMTTLSAKINKSTWTFIATILPGWPFISEQSERTKTNEKNEDRNSKATLTKSFIFKIVSHKAWTGNIGKWQKRESVLMAVVVASSCRKMFIFRMIKAAHFAFLYGLTNWEWIDL